MATMNWKSQKRGLSPFLLIFFLECGLSPFLSPLFAEENTLKLPELIKEAIENNPELKTKKTKIEMLKIRASKMGALEEPRFGFGITNLPTDSFSFSEEDMTMKEFRLMQMIPFPGKLSLREQIATKETNIAEQEYNEKKNEITAKTKSAYYELFFIYKAIEIAEKNKKSLEKFLEIAETKYKTDEHGLQSDVLKAQVELAKMTNEIIMLNQKKETAEAKLNSLLYREPDSKLHKPEEIKKIKVSLKLDELKNTAIENRPFIKSAKLMIERNESALNLAKNELLPDFDLGVTYGQRNNSLTGMKRSDVFSFMLSMNLPFLWGTKGYEVKEADIEINLAKSEYDTMKNDTFFMLRDLLAEIEKGAKTLELYESGILPQARQNLDSTMSNYRANKVDFLTMLDSQMTVYKYETDYFMELKDYQTKIAELEVIIGKELQ